MTRCYFCGASDIKIPNSKITIKGKKIGNRVQFVFVIVVGHGCSVKILKKKLLKILDGKARNNYDILRNKNRKDY